MGRLINAEYCLNRVLLKLIKYYLIVIKCLSPSRILVFMWFLFSGSLVPEININQLNQINVSELNSPLCLPLH